MWFMIMFRSFHFRNTIFIVFIYLFPSDGHLWEAWSLELFFWTSVDDFQVWFVCLCFLLRSEKWAWLLLSDALELRAVLVDLPLTQRSVSSPSPAPRPTCWSKSTASPCPWAWRSTASLSSTWFRFAPGFILRQISQKFCY